MGLLSFTEKGIYCKQADVYIDPWQPVNRALITHAHADHSRWGMKHYLAHELSVPIIKARLGQENDVQGVEYGEGIIINGVKFSFHPAGHIIGSAQIRVEYKGQVEVASGDYKLGDDGVATPFEPIKCHAFITESTFGLPIFRWKPQQETFAEINAWWKQNQEQGKVSVLTGYALGKSQRILQHVDHSIGNVFTHGAIENMNEVIRNAGFPLKDSIRVTPDMDKKDFKGGLVIATPSGTGSSWMKRFQPYSVAIASGWMGLRGARRRRAADRGFVLSDHADWDELNTAIKLTGAEKIIVTHGYTNIFAKWLREQGYDAEAEKTEYEGELAEIGEGQQKEEVAE